MKKILVCIFHKSMEESDRDLINILIRKKLDQIPEVAKQGKFSGDFELLRLIPFFSKPLYIPPSSRF